MSAEWLFLPRREPLPTPPNVGNSRATTPSTSTTAEGKTPFAIDSSAAGSVKVSSASPRSAASTIARAASVTSMLTNGSESPIANHAYSSVLRPLNVAFSGLPVRMSPGSTVVT